MGGLMNLVAFGGTEGNTIGSSRISDFGTFEQSLGFRIEDAVDLSKSPLYNQMKSSSQALGTEVQFTTLNKALSLQKEPQSNLVSTSGGHRENWGESTVAEASPRTDTSTDDKNQRVMSLASVIHLILHERGQLTAVAASDSSDNSKEKSGDQKTLHWLAQNHEAARKSGLRKKVYVQQLQSSPLKLTQIEQELQQALSM
uniref:Uncharacterized protein n=1 Tax=Fagus sylvatica TaxID=28930 RepID=A0A2N9J5M3_FAGSY